MKKKSQSKPSRLTLKGWAAIDNLRREIDLAAGEGNWSAIPELIFQTIELSTAVDRNAFWMESVQLYNEVLKDNQPTRDFPILKTKEKGKPMPWEYSGRSWYFWLNLFGRNYGWSEEQVSILDIDTAIALYQETVIDRQLEMEWDWGLSEISYQFNPSTKKSHFQPLPRPDWMAGIVGKPKEVQKIRLPVTMVPVGNVVDL